MVDKIDVYTKYFDNINNGRCLCCGTSISLRNFHKGHIEADSVGGEDNIGNLVPLCMSCNTKMGAIDFFTYKNTHYPDIKIEMIPEREIELLKTENKLLRKQLNLKEIESLRKENDDLRKKIDEKVKDTTTELVKESSKINVKSKEESTELQLTYSQKEEPTENNKNLYINLFIEYLKKIEYKTNTTLKYESSRYLRTETLGGGTSLYIIKYRNKNLACVLHHVNNELKTILINEKENIKKEFGIELTPRDKCDTIFETFLIGVDTTDISRYQEYREWHINTLQILKNIFNKYS